MFKRSTQQTTPTPTGGFFTRPSTKLGWWSVSLCILFVCLIISSAVLSTSWQDGSGHAIVMAIFGLSTVFCGLTSGVLALWAVVQHKERSWLVWLPLCIGAILVFFLLGEGWGPQ